MMVVVYFYVAFYVAQVVGETGIACAYEICVPNSSSMAVPQKTIAGCSILMTRTRMLRTFSAASGRVKAAVFKRPLCYILRF
jgi:hypothetical protein